MKQLLIVRHAKSSWDDFSIPDFERPLNERGKRDAPVMAQRLVDRNIIPDEIITSPAKRARKTAELFAHTLGLPKENIVETRSLYEASPEVFYEVISKASVSASILILFSHNPGITAFVNKLTSVTIDDMPTCAIFALTCDINNWSEFRAAKKNFFFLIIRRVDDYLAGSIILSKMYLLSRPNLLS